MLVVNHFKRPILPDRTYFCSYSITLALHRWFSFFPLHKNVWVDKTARWQNDLGQLWRDL